MITKTYYDGQLSLMTIKDGRKLKMSGKDKASHTLRIVQFFLTLFKRPLTPPPRFEHVGLP